ncbi:MAG: hypothetical protein GY809_03160 [Planctomycetes bacterium]|nr:hypothetical protein [Planctomycetota bacterium]
MCRAAGSGSRTGPPFEDIKIPFVGDNWWYPKKTYWQMTADFGRGAQHMGSGWKDATSYFRQAD